MQRRKTLVALAAAVLMPRISFAGPTPSPPGSDAYIIWPPDGAVITGGKLWVRMGVRNMSICPKGINRPNVGHHHLLLDTDLPPSLYPENDFFYRGAAFDVIETCLAPNVRDDDEDSDGHDGYA